MASLRQINGVVRSEKERRLVENAAELADHGDVAGYVVAVLYEDGSTCFSVYRPSVEEHRLGNTLFRAWALSTVDLAVD